MSRAVCVYCGSSFGRRRIYREAAADLGREIASRGRDLIYGGGAVGLMGVVADAALAAGGRVVGVIPEALDEREVGHHGISELHVVGSMHERKAMMAELAGAFVAMPGGLGTLEELFETWTWSQLGMHRKPVGLLDVEGYFEPLLRFLESSVEEGFVRPEHRAVLRVRDDPGELLDALDAFAPPRVEKWIEADET
jgi:hypothetical protein